MEHQTGEIRIYVACLAAYNSGYLHGRWINADQPPEEISKAVQAMLKASPIPDAEEHAIHDYDGFEGVRLSEYEGFEGVSKYATFIAEHGELGAELITHRGDIEGAIKALEDYHAGTYDSVEDFARELTEETTEIPSSLAFYIDYERMARDLEINDVFTVETGGTVHIFWSH